MTSYPGFPSTLYWKPDGEGAYKKVGQTQDLDGPGASRNSEEVFHRGISNYYADYIPGQNDGGELSFTIVFDPYTYYEIHGGSGGTSLFESMSVGACTTGIWQIDQNLCGNSGTGYWLFDGSVTGFNPAHPVEGALTAEVTVKVTGQVVYYYSRGTPS